MAVDLRTALGVLQRRLAQVTIWHSIATSLTVLYIVWLAERTTRNHFGLGTSAYDAGLFDQGL
ncbi:MAG: hypothetical protein ACO27J_07495, partial [Ilumatobacteraceae bacterium]